MKVKSLSHVRLFATTRTAARQTSPSSTIPRVCSDSCPSSWSYHPIISSSVVPFSSYIQSFPASGSLQMSQFFTSGGQSIGVSASASVLPMNTQDWSWGWTGWISLQSKGLSRVFSNTTVQKHQFFGTRKSTNCHYLGESQEHLKCQDNLAFKIRRMFSKRQDLRSTYKN